MFRLIRKDIAAFGYLVVYQAVLVILLMSFGLFIDQKGTMTMVALLFYPLLVPTLLLISDKPYFSLWLSLPNSRLAYVLSKYVGGIVLAFAVILIAMLYGHLMTEYVFNSMVNFNEIFSLTVAGALLIPIVLITSITFPIYFRFSTKNSNIALIALFIIILLALILGLVIAEKTWTAPGLSYSKQDIFPVIMHRLSRYINRIGQTQFLYQLIGSICAILITSIGLSIWGFKVRDIDD